MNHKHTLRAVALAAAIVLLAPFTVRPAGPPATDANGDPLPSGARARLGSPRWHAADPVEFVAFLPGGKEFLTVDRGHTCAVWDAGTGTITRQFSLLSPVPIRDGESAVQIPRAPYLLSEDGKTLVTGTQCGRIRLYDLATGKARLFPGGGGDPRNRVLALSGDGKTLVARFYGELFVAWDTESGKEIARYGKLPTDSPGWESLTPELRVSADGKTWVATHRDRGGIVVTRLDAATGRKPSEQIGEAAVQAMTMNADGSLLAVRTAKAIAVYSTATRHRVWTADDPTPVVGSLHFSPDGKYVAHVVGESWSVWDAATGKPVAEPHGPKPGVPPRPTVERGSPVALSPDGKWVALPRLNTLHVFDLLVRKTHAVPQGHEASVIAVAVTPDGKEVVTVGADDTCRRWDAKGRQIGLVELSAAGRLSLSLSPDGGQVALHRSVPPPIRRGFGGKPEPPARLMELVETATGQVTGAPGYEGRDPVLSPGGKLLAVSWAESKGSPFPGVRLIDPAGERPSRLLPMWDDGWPPYAYRLPVFSPDGRLVAVPGYQGGVKVWGTGRGVEVSHLNVGPTGKLRWLCFSPDGRSVAVGVGPAAVRVYEVATGQLRASWDDPGAEARSDTAAAEPSLAGRAAYSPDGGVLAHTTPSGRVLVRDAQTGEVLRELGHDTGRVTALAFFPSGKSLVTAGTDTTPLVWAVPARKPARQQHTAEELKTRWGELAKARGEEAFAAQRKLAADPGAARFLGEALRAERDPEAESVVKLIEELDSDQFVKRQAARAALAKVGESAEPYLEAAREATTSAEVRKSLGELLEGRSGSRIKLTPEQLRIVRAVEVLEGLGTPEAVAALKKLRDGPASRAKLEAEAALKRLGEK